MQQPKAPAANASHFKLAEQQRAIHQFIAPMGHKFDDLLRSEYWAHIANRIQGPMDRIECLAEDYTFYAELMVMDKGTNWVKVVALSGPTDLSASAPSEKLEAEISPFEVTFAGPKARYRVIRKSDNEVIKEGFPTRGDAEKYTTEYRRSLAI